MVEYVHDLMKIRLPQSLSAMVWVCWVSHSIFSYTQLSAYDSQIDHCKWVITLSVLWMYFIMNLKSISWNNLYRDIIYIVSWCLCIMIADSWLCLVIHTPNLILLQNQPSLLHSNDCALIYNNRRVYSFKKFVCDSSPSIQNLNKQ